MQEPGVRLPIGEKVASSIYIYISKVKLSSEEPYNDISVIYTLGGAPICPQLSLQTISGVGTPMASHSMVMVLPSTARRSDGGIRVTVGGANNRTILIDVNFTKCVPKRGM